MIIEKSMKKIIASLMICALAIAGFGVAPQNIKASTSAVTFDGATIREANGETKQAMRFKLTVPDATGVDSCGFVLAKEANIADYESLTVDSPNVIVVSTENSAYRNLYSKDGNKVEYTACITGIPNTDYSTNIVAKAFIKSGETITYATSTETEAKKNIKAVAEGAGRYLSMDGTLSKADFISGEALGTSASFSATQVVGSAYDTVFSYELTSADAEIINNKETEVVVVDFSIEGYKEGVMSLGITNGDKTHMFYGAGPVRGPEMEDNIKYLDMSKVTEFKIEAGNRFILVNDADKGQYKADKLALSKIKAAKPSESWKTIGENIVNKKYINKTSAWQTLAVVDLSDYNLSEYSSVKVEATVDNETGISMCAALVKVDGEFKIKGWTHDAVERKGSSSVSESGLADIAIPDGIPTSGVGLAVKTTTNDFTGNITIDKVILIK